MYYRGAAAAIIVYDITNPDSFAGAKSWVKELQRRGDTNVVIAMVSCRESSRTSWYWGGASHFIKLSLNVTLYHKPLPHFTRREIKQILSLVGKWTSMRQTHTPRRMESCTWKHRLRIRTMFARYLWKLQRAYQRQFNNQRGRRSPSCHRSRSREIVAKGTLCVVVGGGCYCFHDLQCV